MPLPHEWLMGGMLALTTVRLVAHGAAGHWVTWMFGLLTALVPVTVIWCAGRPTRLRWLVRLLFHPAAMGAAFFLLGPAVRLLGVASADPWLRALDRSLLGTNLSVAWERWSHPWLTDAMAIAYFSFYYYLVAGPGWYAIRDPRRFRSAIVGLFSIYGIGLICYQFWPALGPYAAESFQGPLPDGGLSRWMLAIVKGGTNGVDVFPSLHMACSLFLLGFDRHYRPSHFRWMLLPTVLLWMSTLYLRYHYFTDLWVGAVLGLAGLWLARRFENSPWQTRIDLEMEAAGR